MLAVGQVVFKLLPILLGHLLETATGKLLTFSFASYFLKRCSIYYLHDLLSSFHVDSPLMIVQKWGLLWFSSVSCSVVSDSLWPHESQHTRPPCPSSTPRVYSNPCPSSQWCHPAISSSVIPFSSCPQSLPASGSFPMSQFFTWGGQSIGVSASTSVLPMNTQDWSPLG